MSELPSVDAEREITFRFEQDDYDEFARLSGDVNPIHVDPDFSSRTRFGKTVAHAVLPTNTLQHRDAASDSVAENPAAGDAAVLSSDSFADAARKKSSRREPDTHDSV